MSSQTAPPLRSNSGCIGIVAAFSWEVRPLLRKCPGIRQLDAQLYSMDAGGQSVLLTVGGMGKDSAIRAAEALCRRAPLRGLVALGFAGALADSLAPGDVMIAGRLLDQQSREEFHCSEHLLMPHGVERGTLLTVQRTVTSAAEKRRLAKDWGADAADMESSGVALVAARAGIPFCAIRSITDSCNQGNAIDFTQCQSEDGTLSLFQVVRQGLQSFQGLRTLWELAQGSRLAARNLAEALSPAWQ